jgi:hypothetical protein
VLDCERRFGEPLAHEQALGALLARPRPGVTA